MPRPSLNSAIVRWTIPASRSASPEVASEQLAGCTGMPRQQFSRSLIVIARALPVLRGTVCSRLLNTPISAEVWDVDSVRFRPHGRQSGLLRRSISISPASGSTSTVTSIFTPSSTPGSGTASWMS